jgi:hypothetical protein
MEERIGTSGIAVLADHDIEGHARLLWNTLESEGWTELYPIEMLMFADVGLATDSTDRNVWRFAQAHQMILLTANRNMEDENSLEQTLREENTAVSLPVLTVRRPEYLKRRIYREQCAEKLLEIAIDIHKYLGTGRFFIP